MGITSFKRKYIKHHGSNSALKVIPNLTELSFEGEQFVESGVAYECKLVPSSGKYLPQVISITGTKSKYAFAYDYTTGVIYIPSGEIIGDIAITATASDINHNIPAVLSMTKQTNNTYDGATTLTGQSYIILNVVPCRGSTVSVEYGGLVKTVTGSISTDVYESVAQLVYFGKFGALDDDGTPASGNLTITGAYEAYRAASVTTDSKGKVAFCPFGIVECGAIRYLPTGFTVANSLTATFTHPVEFIESDAIDGYDGGITGDFTFTNSIPDAPDMIINCGGSTNNSYYHAYSYLRIPTPDWSFWACQDRVGYLGQESRSSSSTGIQQTEESSCTFDGVASDSITGTIVLNEGLDRIGDYTFCGFGISEITFPHSIKSIGDYAFYKVPLNKILIENTDVETIGAYAFYDYNSSMSEVKLGNKLKTIGDSAFANLAASSIIIPDSVTTISNSAFYQSKLTSVVIEGAPTIGSSAFTPYIGTPYLVNVDLGRTISIGNKAFSQNTLLTNINLPNSIISIDEMAFYNTGLTSVLIPESVSTIGLGAFAYCRSLSKIDVDSSNPNYVSVDGVLYNKSMTKCLQVPAGIASQVTVPATVSSVDEYTFAGCSMNITMLSTTPPAVSSLTGFSGTFTVPAGCGEAYKAATGWSSYSSKITEASA